MSESPESAVPMDVPLPDAEPNWLWQTVIVRTIVWGSALAAFVLFWYAGSAFALPTERGFAASLLSGQPLGNLLTTAIVYLGIVGGAAVLLGSAKPVIGTWAAAFGLTALSIRSGTTGDALRSSAGNIYAGMLLETILLAAITLVGFLLHRLLVRPPPIAATKDEDDAPDFSGRLLSTAVQTIAMIVLVWLLTPADAKGQCLAAVFVAGFVATLTADSVLPVGISPLAIVPPFAAAIVAYAWATASTSAGQTQAPMPLANPIPLDYASLGVAGAILGHWVTHQWRVDAEE